MERSKTCYSLYWLMSCHVLLPVLIDICASLNTFTTCLHFIVNLLLNIVTLAAPVIVQDVVSIVSVVELVGIIVMSKLCKF